jgi:hypothetical protein
VERPTGPYRAAFHLAKYNDGRTPADGDPDEVQIVSQWFDPDGTPIDDDARIAELEAAHPLEEAFHG